LGRGIIQELIVMEPLLLGVSNALPDIH
jgi:hypothetical protein